MLEDPRVGREGAPLEGAGAAAVQGLLNLPPSRPTHACRLSGVSRHICSERVSVSSGGFSFLPWANAAGSAAASSTAARTSTCTRAISSACEVAGPGLQRRVRRKDAGKRVGADGELVRRGAALAPAQRPLAPFAETSHLADCLLAGLGGSNRAYPAAQGKMSCDGRTASMRRAVHSAAGVLGSAPTCNPSHSCLPSSFPQIAYLPHPRRPYRLFVDHRPSARAAQPWTPLRPPSAASRSGKAGAGAARVWGRQRSSCLGGTGARGVNGARTLASAATLRQLPAAAAALQRRGSTSHQTALPNCEVQGQERRCTAASGFRHAALFSSVFSGAAAAASSAPPTVLQAQEGSIGGQAERPVGRRCASTKRRRLCKHAGSTPAASTCPRPYRCATPSSPACQCVCPSSPPCLTVATSPCVMNAPMWQHQQPAQPPRCTTRPLPPCRVPSPLPDLGAAKTVAVATDPMNAPMAQLPPRCGQLA